MTTKEVISEIERLADRQFESTLKSRVAIMEALRFLDEGQPGNARKVLINYLDSDDWARIWRA